MEESRLQSNLKKKAYHNIVIAVVGIIILIIILVLFGMKLLVGFSLLSEKLPSDKNNKTMDSQKTNVYVAPPQLNPLVEATSSAKITVTGYATKDQVIHLYVNGELVDKSSVRNDNHFSFQNVALQKGKNTIKALAATADNNKSEYSNELTITLLTKPPNLTINQPQDGQGFDKNGGQVSIQGQTDPAVSVTINGSVAIVDDQGKFNYLYTLHDGDNDLHIVAIDNAGNKTTKDIHIHTN